ncbi:interleukin 17-like protein [Lytechinus variegatus]|uniref:interleukin 17-like protein n=1 Tax=Lytechinus variegatus TaxID=7654 RepID=UPI001BB11962|nr:interleukin 17-like protein [Lytechinus variegatus]
MAMITVRNVFLVAMVCLYIQAAFSIPLQPSSDGTGLSGIPDVPGKACLADDPEERVRRQQDAHSLFPYQKVYAVQSFNYSSPDVFSDALPALDCPMGTKETEVTRDVSTESTCPFTYVTCYDPDRIPARLTVAQCGGSSCIDPYKNEEDPELSCQPVYYNIKVLRRKSCKNGMFHYEEQDERIPVACACMRQEAAKL